MTERLQHQVYRIDSKEGELTNRNAANLPGLVYLLEKAESNQIMLGNNISVFDVSQSPEFGSYDYFRGGKSMSEPGNLVGRMIKAKIGEEDAIYFSFPQDADWQATYKGSIPLEDFYRALKEEDPNNTLQLDEQVEILEELVEDLLNEQ